MQEESLFSALKPSPDPRGQLEQETRGLRDRFWIELLCDYVAGQPSELLGLRPWEMIRQDWQLIVHPVKKAYEKGIAIGNAVAACFLARYGFTHNGYAFHAGSVSNSRHEVQVAYALLRGEFVPIEVREQYPRAYWLSSFDLRGFAHLPYLVQGCGERAQAVCHWAREKQHAYDALEAGGSYYESELELTLRIGWLQGLITGLISSS
jgi:hypothetical protein